MHLGDPGLLPAGFIAAFISGCAVLRLHLTCLDPEDLGSVWSRENERAVAREQALSAEPTSKEPGAFPGWVQSSSSVLGRSVPPAPGTAFRSSSESGEPTVTLLRTRGSPHERVQPSGLGSAWGQRWWLLDHPAPASVLLASSKDAGFAPHYFVRCRFQPCEKTHTTHMAFGTGLNSFMKTHSAKWDLYFWKEVSRFCLSYLSRKDSFSKPGWRREIIWLIKNTILKKKKRNVTLFEFWQDSGGWSQEEAQMEDQRLKPPASPPHWSVSKEPKCIKMQRTQIIVHTV